MGFEAIVADPLTEPVPPGWAELGAAAGLAATWDADLVAGLAWCATRPPLMTVVTDGSRPCALFHASVAGPSRGRFVRPGRPVRPGLVMCHLPPGIGAAGHAFHPDLDESGRAAAVSAFERAVRNRLRVRCAGFAYRQVPASDLPVFRRRPRLVRPAAPESVIRNEWDSMDGYLSSLPARTRKDFARTLRRVEADPLVLTAVEPSLPGGEAARLLHTVQSRYAAPRAAFPGVYYARLSDRRGVRFFTYRERDGSGPAEPGALLAFGLLVDDGAGVRCQGWGTRGEARRHYYADHFLRQIGYLIDHRRREMVMGKSMNAEKARFGAALRPLHTVVSW